MQLSSSSTIMPPEPIIDPALVSESKSMGVSSRLAGRQPPEGPPICTPLKAFLLGMPPPTSKTTWRSVVPMGTSTRPVWATFPARANSAVPLLPSGPDAGEPVGAFLDDQRHAGEGLHVVQQGRLSPQAGFGRVRRPHSGHAPLALDGVHQGAGFAADESAGALHNVNAEAETAVHDIVPQNTGGLGLLERNAEALHRQRVLVANVDVCRGMCPWCSRR